MKQRKNLTDVFLHNKEKSIERIAEINNWFLLQ
jgi:hypothetical protein